MIINKRTLDDLIKSGETETVYRIVRSLSLKLNACKTEAIQHEQIVGKLRGAFIEAETDRDRLKRMVRELLRLRGQDRLSSEAIIIVRKYGGPEGTKNDESAITIEME